MKPQQWHNELGYTGVNFCDHLKRVKIIQE